MIRLLLILLPLWATAQTVPGWYLNDNGTIGGITYEELRLASVYRIGQNQLTKNAVLEIGALNGQVAGLRRIADTERTSKEAMQAAWDGCEVERADLLVDRDRWKSKAKGRGRNTVLWMAAALVAGILIAR